MPFLPDLWDTAIGGILDLAALGSSLSVYIWLLILAVGGHVLVGYGLVTLGDFLLLALLCLVVMLLSAILTELKWHGDYLRAHGVKLDILIEPSITAAAAGKAAGPAAARG